jgi:hypothetical protein
MNGVCIRSVSDLRLILHDYHEEDAVRGPAYLTGITILFGALTPMACEPEQIEFSEQDHATARVVWSIIATEAIVKLPLLLQSIIHLAAVLILDQLLPK